MNEYEKLLMEWKILGEKTQKAITELSNWEEDLLTKDPQIIYNLGKGFENLISKTPKGNNPYDEVFKMVANHHLELMKQLNDVLQIALL